MLVVVKKPRIELEIKEGAENVLPLLKEEYGEAQIYIIDNEYTEVRESDFYKKTKVSPGDAVSTYRWNSNLTQKQLAEKVGKSAQFISDIENGRRNVSVNLARQFGTVFKVPFERFL